MIRVAVSGASGSMGRRLISLIAEQSDCALACAVERPGHPDLGKDAGLVAGVSELGVPITEQVCGAPDVVLDFSAPEASVGRATECAALGTAVVLGTTGLSPEQVQRLERDVGTRIPLLIAPNMSVGAWRALRRGNRGNTPSAQEGRAERDGPETGSHHLPGAWLGARGGAQLREAGGGWGAAAKATGRACCERGRRCRGSHDHFRRRGGTHRADPSGQQPGCVRTGCHSGRAVPSRSAPRPI